MSPAIREMLRIHIINEHFFIQCLCCLFEFGNKSLVCDDAFFNSLILCYNSVLSCDVRYRDMYFCNILVPKILACTSPVYISNISMEFWSL